MKVKPANVDEYIEKSPAFAQPVLHRFRKLVLQVCPQAEEMLKWGHPSFEYKGILCGMAAFKNYCALVFWKGALMQESAALLQQVGQTDMGRLDKITSLQELPSDKILKAYIKEAVRLNDEGIKMPVAKKVVKKELAVPEDLLKALKKNKAALAVFDKFSPTNKREYVEWIEGAKTQATRDKRVVTAVEWMAEGKVRQWKYARR